MNDKDQRENGTPSAIPQTPGPGGLPPGATWAPQEDEEGPKTFIQPVPFAPSSDDSAMMASQAQTVMHNHFVMADFWPSCVQRGISLQGKLPVFQPFSCVMQCANSYLAQNPRLRVYRCETIECTTDFHGRFNASKNVDLDSAEGWRIFVRGLRLWCIDNPEPVPLQLWYLNLMPQNSNNEVGGYEGMTKTMERLNNYFCANPIPGYVITVDAVNLRLYGKKAGVLDLDRSCRGAAASDVQSLLMCFRVFFVMGPPAGEHLGVVKFVPESSVRGSKVRWAELDEMLMKATSWALRPNLRVTNFQTIRTPVRIFKNHGATCVDVAVDDTKMVFNNSCSVAFCLLAFFTYRPDGREIRSAFPSGTLTSRTFMPYKVGGNTYESVQDTLQRISVFLHFSESNVVSAETIAIPHNPQFNVIHHEKLSYDMIKGKGQYYVYIYRLYFDGICREVNPALLPRPKFKSSMCSIM